jgi:long-chain acyl-CoA synthetase
MGARVRALAGHLAALGIVPGSRVLLALPNVPATVVAGLALNALGATSVEVSRAWGSQILGDIVRRSGVRHAFVWARDAQMWRAALEGLPLPHLLAAHRGALPAAFAEAFAGMPATSLAEDGSVGPDLAASPLRSMPDLSPDWPALVLYTSGSTGTPHGVVQTFRNVDANTRSIVEYLRITAEDRALLALPLHYCYGRSVLQTHLFVGGSVFLEGRMAFPRTVLEAIAAEGCTGFAGVPLSFEIFRRQADISAIGFPRLRYLTQAGGAMAPDTIAWARVAFRPAQLYVMYGQTEATARLSYLPPERAVDKAGSIGIPIPGVELRVVDEHGNGLPPGEIGELVARGPNVTPGYLDEPEETAAILHDGWLWTGDLAERDADGFFYHRGRAKEILKIGGHRVSPIEIEQVIARHPDVAETAVIGLSHGLMGEVPHAFVVPRPGATPEEADLLSFCRERMPAYRVPVGFTLVPALPRSESGKLLRAEVAAPHGEPILRDATSGQQA